MVTLCSERVCWRAPVVEDDVWSPDACGRNSDTRHSVVLTGVPRQLVVTPFLYAPAQTRTWRRNSTKAPAAAVMAAKGRIAAATYRITAAHAGYPLYSTMRRQIPSPKVVPSFTEWYAPMTYSERGWWGLNPRPVTCPTNFISPCNLAYTSSLQSRTMLLALLCIINRQARILPRYDRTREAILTCAQKLT